MKNCIVCELPLIGEEEISCEDCDKFVAELKAARIERDWCVAETSI